MLHNILNQVSMIWIFDSISLTVQKMVRQMDWTLSLWLPSGWQWKNDQDLVYIEVIIVRKHRLDSLWKSFVLLTSFKLQLVVASAAALGLSLYCCILFWIVWLMKHDNGGVVCWLVICLSSFVSSIRFPDFPTSLTICFFLLPFLPIFSLSHLFSCFFVSFSFSFLSLISFSISPDDEDQPYQ